MVTENNTTSTNNKQLNKTVNIMYEIIKNFKVYNNVNKRKI